MSKRRETGGRNAAGTRTDEEQPGLVIANHGHISRVEDGYGRIHRCVGGHRQPRPVCGDRVRWRPTGRHAGQITAIETRSNLLARPGPNGTPRPLAANLAHVFVVVAPEPTLQELLIDQYLVTAEYFGLPTALLLNKTDLADEGGLASLRARLFLYEELGYSVCLSTTRREGGLDALRSLLRDGANLLVGQSGVGKSSLIRELVPDARVEVGEISGSTGLGRHTTSATTLYHLPSGGDMIDSPGVRDFGVWHIPEDSLAQGFVEFRPWLGRCQFRNCRHLEEPGCAIKGAVEGGSIPDQRYRHYERMRRPR